MESFIICVEYAASLSILLMLKFNMCGVCSSCVYICGWDGKFHDLYHAAALRSKGITLPQVKIFLTQWKQVVAAE